MNAKILYFVLLTIITMYADEKTNSKFTFLREKTYNCGGQKHTVKEYVHNKTKLEFVLIPAGNFMMGSDNYGEKPRHKVIISSFLMAKKEITQEAWFNLMKTNPWKDQRLVKDGNKYPVNYITWKQAKTFCNKAGLKLPTEAQWEYACRSGSRSKYYWGNSINDDYLWHKKNTYDVNNQHAQEVGLKKPNAFGLHDMSGNVWEWCSDWYNSSYYRKSPRRNPRGPSKGTVRIYRGGGWYNTAKDCRSANRTFSSVDRSSLIGFRPCAIWKK